MVHPYCLFPGCIVTWVWSLAVGQYTVSWLLTGAPEQRYWQNEETANIGLVSSVGRQSGDRRFKSRSRKFVLSSSKNMYTLLKYRIHSCFDWLHKHGNVELDIVWQKPVACTCVSVCVHIATASLLIVSGQHTQCWVNNYGGNWWPWISAMIPRLKIIWTE